MHLDDVSLPQIIISSDYDASSRKISSRRSVQFLNEPMSFGANFFSLFIGFFFHDSAHDTHDTGNKENFVLNDTTRLTHFMHTQFNETGFEIFLDNRQHLVVSIVVCSV